MRGYCFICIVFILIFASDYNSSASNCKFISFNIRYDNGYDGVIVGVIDYLSSVIFLGKRNLMLSVCKRS